MNYSQIINSLIFHINQQNNIKNTPNISFSNLNELNRQDINEYNRGVFFGKDGTILIHRNNIDEPDVSYLQEIITILHEWGHFQNMRHYFLENGSIICKSKYGYDYDKTGNEQPIERFIEEVMAWIAGTNSLYRFLFRNLKIRNPLIYIQIFLYTGRAAVPALYGYLNTTILHILRLYE